MNEDLNYKEGYYFLFNKITDLQKSLKSIQNKAEQICTDEETYRDMPLDAEQIIQNMADYIQNQQDND